MAFFGDNAGAYNLYRAFEEKLLALFPRTQVRFQKTQITFSARHVYACLSLLRVRKKAELPSPYIVVTLGLPYPLESDRAAVKTQPYPGRWTNHIVIGEEKEIDDELLGWAEEAYHFAQAK